MKTIKLSLLLIAFSLGLTLSNAQNAKWGGQQISPTTIFSPRVIKTVDDKVFTYGSTTTAVSVSNDYKILFEVVSKSKGRTTMSKEIVFEKPKKVAISLEKIMVIKENFYAFFSEFNKKKEEMDLVAYKIDGKTGKKGKRIKIMTVEVDGKSARKRGTMNVVVSQDDSKIVANHYSYYKKSKKYVDKYHLFDTDLNEITHKHITVKRGETYSTKGHIVDNDGSVYFLAGNTSDLGSFQITSLDALKDYEKWEENVSLGEYARKLNIDYVKDRMMILNLSIGFNGDGNLLMLGTYAKSAKRVSKSGIAKKGYQAPEIGGVWSIIIDDVTKEVVAGNMTEISQEFKDEFRKSRDAKKGTAGKIAAFDPFFNKTRIYPLNDGGNLYLEEQYYHAYTYDQNDNITGEIIYHGSVSVHRLDANGKLLWSRRVNKRQRVALGYRYGFVYGTNGFTFGADLKRMETYHSYGVQVTGDKVNIIFLDNVKNAAIKSVNVKRKWTTRPQKAGLHQTSFDLTTGKRTEGNLKSSPKGKMFHKPSYFFQEKQGDDLILFSQWKKKYSYGVLKSK